MTNMIQNAKDQAAALALAAYRAAAEDGSLPQAEVRTAPVEVPRDAANGDFTTTFALAASKALRQPPPGHCPGPAGPHGAGKQLLCLRRNRRPGLSEFPAGPAVV